MMRDVLWIISLTLGAFAAVAAMGKSRGKPVMAWLCCALASCVAVEVLDVAAMDGMGDSLLDKRLSFVANVFSCLGWYLFSLRYARQSEKGLLLRQKLVVVGLLVLAVAAAVFSPLVFLSVSSLPGKSLLTLTRYGLAFNMGLLLAITLALMNLEYTLANTSHLQRWSIKFVVLGAASVLMAKVLFISQGLLYAVLDFTLMPARQTGLAVGALLISYSLIFRDEEARITLSPRLAYKSLALLAVGLYLFSLGLFGQVVRLFGPEAERTAFWVVAFLSGACLAALLLSDTFRRKVRVAMRQHLNKDKYDYRQQWLEFTRRLASRHSYEELCQAVLAGFCETLGMGGAMLYLRKPGSATFASVSNWAADFPAQDLDEEHTFIQDLLEAQCVLDLRPDPLVPGDQAFPPHGAACAFCVPMFDDSSLAGFILLCRPFNKEENYDQEDFDLMEALGSQGYVSIQNQRLADALRQAREMEIVSRVSAFIVHDLKNLVYTLSLMVDNAEEYIEDPAFQADMLKSLRNTVAKMKKLIAQLNTMPGTEPLHLEPLELGALASQTLEILQGGLFEVRAKDGPIWVNADKEQLQKVLLNLCLNAQEASEDHRPVTLEIGVNSVPYMRVRDRGCGMDDAFIRNDLFVPFKTTKPKGMGIGLYQSRQIMEAHGGDIQVASAPGRGSVFTLLFPKPEMG